MLFTPSSSDSLPLIPATPLSSSCGMNDRLIIQRPPSEAGPFAWSDFPIIETDSIFQRITAHNAYSSSFSSPLDSYMEDSLSTSSHDSYVSLSSTEKRSFSSSASSRNNKLVKFSPTLEVRTHSIILGDHPLCTILPVELGWDYADTEHVDLELHEMQKAYHGKARRRSYLERKQLLQDFVAEENLQSNLHQQPNLRKGGSSSRQLTAMG